CRSSRPPASRHRMLLVRMRRSQKARVRRAQRPATQRQTPPRRATQSRTTQRRAVQQPSRTPAGATPAVPPRSTQGPAPTATELTGASRVDVITPARRGTTPPKKRRTKEGGEHRHG